MEHKTQGFSQIFYCIWAKAHFAINPLGPSAKADGNEREGGLFHGSALSVTSFLR
jgi:predicted secreted protein